MVVELWLEWNKINFLFLSISKKRLKMTNKLVCECIGCNWKWNVKRSSTWSAYSNKSNKIYSKQKYALRIYFKDNNYTIIIISQRFCKLV